MFGHLIGLDAVLPETPKILIFGVAFLSKRPSLLDVLIFL
jgi:hypothetical protein